MICTKDPNPCYILISMDITNYFKEHGGADPQKKSDKEVPVEEPEIDTGDERDPEVEEILFEEERGIGEDEVAEPVVIEDPILVDERVDDWDNEFEEVRGLFSPLKSLFYRFLKE